jgi:hypothetical protein
MAEEVIADLQKSMSKKILWTPFKCYVVEPTFWDEQLERNLDNSALDRDMFPNPAI